MEKIILDHSRLSKLSLKIIALLSFCIWFGSCFNNQQKLTVNSLFSDGMVLQRDTLATIWGKSVFNQSINITTSWGENFVIESDSAGNWFTKLQTPIAGGPHSIIIKADKEMIEVNDIMVGEVWIASGQSNMAMPLKGWPPKDPIDNSDFEIENAKYPYIRMFEVERSYSAKPYSNLKGNWKKGLPKAVGDFSATAYFFSRSLYKELNVPIGIINTSWGGTPVESWTSISKLKEIGLFSEITDIYDKNASEDDVYNWFKNFKSVKVPKQKNANDKLKQKYKDIQFLDEDLSLEDINDRNWRKVILPGRFDNLLSSFDGAVWLRKEIFIDDISDDYALFLGYVDDMDKTFINGNFIGGLSGLGVAHTERFYNVPKEYLKNGVNLLAIRAIDTGGPGYIEGPMKLYNNYGKTISISGEWRCQPIAELYDENYIVYKIGTDFSDRVSYIKLNPWVPSSLFNGMINPIIPFTMKGAIWYQGEANVGRAEQYEILFPSMIEDWREKWEAEFPFYYVQIAPFRYQKDPKNQVSQKLRDAQRKTLKLPNTGMVVTMDIGNFDNIHPSNKKDVGERLASYALKNDYNQDSIASEPIIKSVERDNSKIKIEFTNIGSGLINLSDRGNEFEIAGPENVFVKAKVDVFKDHILVYSDSIKDPRIVRYAWSDTPIATLFNSDSLPSSSFRISLE